MFKIIPNKGASPTWLGFKLKEGDVLTLNTRKSFCVFEKEDIIKKISKVNGSYWIIQVKIPPFEKKVRTEKGILVNKVIIKSIRLCIPPLVELERDQVLNSLFSEESTKVKKWKLDLTCISEEEWLIFNKRWASWPDLKKMLEIEEGIELETRFLCDLVIQGLGATFEGLLIFSNLTKLDFSLTDLKIIYDFCILKKLVSAIRIMVINQRKVPINKDFYKTTLNKNKWALEKLACFRPSQDLIHYFVKKRDIQAINLFRCNYRLSVMDLKDIFVKAANNSDYSVVNWLISHDLFDFRFLYELKLETMMKFKYTAGSLFGFKPHVFEFLNKKVLFEICMNQMIFFQGRSKKMDFIPSVLDIITYSEKGETYLDKIVVFQKGLPMPIYDEIVKGIIEEMIITKFPNLKD